jgi:hypothetical protein
LSKVKTCADLSTPKRNRINEIKNMSLTPPLEELGDRRGIKMRSTTTARSCPVEIPDLMSIAQEARLKCEG